MWRAVIAPQRLRGQELLHGASGKFGMNVAESEAEIAVAQRAGERSCRCGGRSRRSPRARSATRRSPTSSGGIFFAPRPLLLRLPHLLPQRESRRRLAIRRGAMA